MDKAFTPPRDGQDHGPSSGMNAQAPPVLPPDERAISSHVAALFEECDVEGDLRASAFRKDGGKDVAFYGRAFYCERLVHGHHNARITDDPASIDAAIKLLASIAKDVAKHPRPAVVCPPFSLFKPGEQAALAISSTPPPSSSTPTTAPSKRSAKHKRSLARRHTSWRAEATGSTRRRARSRPSGMRTGCLRTRRAPRPRSPA